VTVLAQIFHALNLNWLLVLIVGTAATAIGTVLTNAVTVTRPHNELRLWSEVLVNQHLTYFAFFPALITALDLTEFYKNSCFAVLLVSFVFFVLGLMNIRGHDKAIEKDHKHTCSDTSCETLGKEATDKIICLNATLSAMSLILAALLVFSLQFGKK